MSEFRIDLRVRFAETDAMGVAHHAAYLPYLETARVEYLRALGHPYRELRDRDGLEFAVVGVDLRYHAPLRFDDAFTVSCALAERARATFSLAYRVELGAPLILSGRTRHAVLDRETGARALRWLAPPSRRRVRHAQTTSSRCSPASAPCRPAAAAPSRPSLAGSLQQQGERKVTIKLGGRCASCGRTASTTCSPPRRPRANKVNSGVPTTHKPIVFKPTKKGKYVFYCAPHKALGMVLT